MLYLHFNVLAIIKYAKMKPIDSIYLQIRILMALVATEINLP